MTQHADLVKRLKHVAAYMADATGMTVEPPKNESWPKLLIEAAEAIERLDNNEARIRELLKHADLYVDPTGGHRAKLLSETIAKAVQT